MYSFFTIFQVGLPAGLSYKQDNITATYLTVLKDAVVSKYGNIFYWNMKLFHQECPTKKNSRYSQE